MVVTSFVSHSPSQPTAKSVSYKSGDETVQGLLYTPAGKGPFPAHIVIHEYWGLNDWVKEQASKLADQGYEALAIDLYRGKVATTPDVAHELMRGVPEDRAKRDLHAAFEFLQSQPNVKKDRIGAIGWCMGGGYSLDVALQEPTLAADVINYGHLATDPEALKKINAPILGLFGGQDQGITPDDVHKFEAAMKQPGKKSRSRFMTTPAMPSKIQITKTGYRADRYRGRLEAHGHLSGGESQEIIEIPRDRMIDSRFSRVGDPVIPLRIRVKKLPRVCQALIRNGFLMALISTCQKIPIWLLCRILQCSPRSTSARPFETTGCRKACLRETSKNAPGCCAAIFASRKRPYHPFA